MTKLFNYTTMGPKSVISAPSDENNVNQSVFVKEEPSGKALTPIPKQVIVLDVDESDQDKEFDGEEEEDEDEEGESEEVHTIVRNR